VAVYSASSDRRLVVTTCIAPVGLACLPIQGVYRTTEY
jgi:hypothetical protein